MPLTCGNRLVAAVHRGSIRTCVRSLLTAAAAVDDAGRLDRVRRLAAERNRLDAELAAAVRDGEVHQSAEHDGLKSMKSWLRTHTRLSGAAIGGLVRQGRAMAQLPAVEAAFRAGAITGDQVEVIAEIVTPENLDRAGRAGHRPRRGRGGVRRDRHHPALPRPADGRRHLPGPARPRRHRTRPHRGPLADAGAAPRRRGHPRRRPGPGGRGEGDDRPRGARRGRPLRRRHPQPRAAPRRRPRPDLRPTRWPPATRRSCARSSRSCWS